MDEPIISHPRRKGNPCALCGSPTKKSGATYCSRACSDARTNRPSTHPLYKTWAQMMSRCYRKRDSSYKYYGERGIEVCPEWHSFWTFETWALAQSRASDTTLDRKDNSIGYSPDNCRFVNRTIQQRNRSCNVILTAFGESKTAVEWASDSRCNVGYQGLVFRVHGGMPHEAAITTPGKRGNPFHFTAEESLALLMRSRAGETRTALAAAYGVTRSTVSRAILRATQGELLTHVHPIAAVVDHIDAAGGGIGRGDIPTSASAVAKDALG
jgi:hypothetical protein